MALAVKVVGALNIEASYEAFHVVVHLQAADGRHLASVRTGNAAEVAPGAGAMWNEELVLPISNDAGSEVASVLFELQGGSARDSAAHGIGSAAIDWPTVCTNAVGDGWATEPPLLAAHGVPNGSRLLVRLLHVDAAASAAKLKQLKAQVSEAISVTGRERQALLSAATEHTRQLSSTRTQLTLKLRTVSQKATEKEVGDFRAALESRLQAARSGRDAALVNFNVLHQQALRKAMPRVHERLNREARQQREAIGRVGGKARETEAKMRAERRQQWQVRWPLRASENL